MVKMMLLIMILMVICVDDTSKENDEKVSENIYVAGVDYELNTMKRPRLFLVVFLADYLR